MPDFETRFDSQNDVIYGTGDWIHVYLYNFWFTWPYGYTTLKDINDKSSGMYKSRSLNPYDPSKPTDVDQVTAAAHAKYGVNVINNYNLPIKSNLFKGQKPQGGTATVVANKKPVIPLQKSPTDRQRYEDYFKCLEKSVGYGPGSLMGGADHWANALAKYEQGDTLDMNVKKDVEKLPGIVSDIAIRRSCKFGIHYFVERKAAKLHYILDGMDVDAIVKKDRMLNESTGKHKVPICTSEVRYIFRHWNRLAATNRLLFYHDFDAVDAPWSNQKYQGTWAGWAEYALHRYNKHQARVPSGVKKTRMAWAINAFTLGKNAITARSVIDCFHGIPSALMNDPQDDTLLIT